MRSVFGARHVAGDTAEAKNGRDAAPTPRFAALARNLTVVNLSLTLAAVVTSPLQARALGPSGRGDLAALTVVGGLIALMGEFGLSAYVVRESARGASLRRLVGSVGPLLFGVGVIYAVTAPQVAHLVAGNRRSLHSLLLVMLLLMPLFMPALATNALVWGRQRWRLYAVQRLMAPIGTVIVYSALFILHRLTVVTAGVTYIVLATVANLVGLVVLRGVGLPEWHRATATRALSFGSRVWLTSLANQTNARLDQLLMTRLTTSAQLGLYVVAVNVSLLQHSLTSAVASALLPRVASGDASVSARALRLMLVVTTMLSIAIFVTAPFIVPLVFGQRFSGAVSMCEILVVASIPFGAVQVLTAALVGVGQPGVAARGEILSVFITVPALVIFVGRYGGIAAALTSIAAYTVTSLYLGFYARRHLGLTAKDMLVPRRSDLAALVAIPFVGRFFG